MFHKLSPALASKCSCIYKPCIDHVMLRNTDNCVIILRWHVMWNIRRWQTSWRTLSQNVNRASLLLTQTTSLSSTPSSRRPVMMSRLLQSSLSDYTQHVNCLREDHKPDHCYQHWRTSRSRIDLRRPNCTIFEQNIEQSIGASKVFRCVAPFLNESHSEAIGMGKIEAKF